jgi:hypothetical protein
MVHYLMYYVVVNRCCTCVLIVFCGGCCNDICPKDELISLAVIFSSDSCL